MAVYTEVAFEDANRLMQALQLGPLTHLQGIASGIENTNYYATTPQGQWVLTLFERLSAEQLPYYLQLTQHLAAHGIPVPAPQANSSGQLLHQLAGKPAAVVTRLPGSHRMAPQAAHCAQVGAMLARMHLAGASAPLQQARERDLAWCAATAADVLPHLQAPQAALLQTELVHQRTFAASAVAHSLPQGAIHADLFRDNVMFDDTAGASVGDDRLCGFFDFYFAGTDALLFDVAVCLNDWCTDTANTPTSGALDPVRALAFTQAYQQVRAFTAAEVQALPTLLRAAALRFWVSRLWDWHLPRSAALLQAKDPTHFERVLRLRASDPYYPRLVA
jgi:homoserine kinase type II